MSPPPISEEKILAIVNDALSTMGTKDGSVRQIALRHGVADRTVRRYIKERIPEEQQPLARYIKGAEVQSASNAERRAKLAARFLDVAEKAINDLERPYLLHAFGGLAFEHVQHQADEPPSADKRNLITVAAIALDKSLVAERADDEKGAGSAAVDAFLAIMAPKPNTKLK